MVFVRGVGSNLFDADGNRFVDLAAGFGSAILGHGPSPAHAAAEAQLGTLAQGLGDLYPTDRKIELLDELATLHPDPDARVILTQSGADAVTAAIKTAMLATGKPGVVAFEGAYHGLSYAQLAACGFAPSFREPFAAQLGDHVRFVPYPGGESDLDRVLAAIDRALDGGAIGAILIEPILGRGGVVVPPASFLAEVAARARAAGALLVADEIWTGIGRSGALVKSVADGIDPDMICLGKGLGASFPISACVGRGAVMAAWASGGSVVHTSTHAGAPLGCAAALATLAAVRSRDLAARASTVGERLMVALRDALRGSARVSSVRGAGLMVGVVLDAPGAAAHLAQNLLGRGYVTTLGGAAADTLVLTPPLTIDEGVLLGVVDAMGQALAEAA